VSVQTRLLLGRTIVGVDMRSWVDHAPGGRRRTFHDPHLTLDDGSVLRFLVREPDGGSEYGIELIRDPPPVGKR